MSKNTAPVVVTRKHKRTRWFWHAVTLGLTGGMSAPLNAAVAARNAGYNATTRKLAAEAEAPPADDLAARAAAAGRSVASQRARERAAARK